MTTHGPRRCIVLPIVWLLAAVHLAAGGDAWAQSAWQPHRLQSGLAPPGAIGRQQLQRGGPWVGYFQPVKLIPPQGAKVALARKGRFEPPQASLTVGLLIGPVYRLRVTQIPGHPGKELYPTVELIDRTFAPAKLAVKFPVPIHLDQNDLELALQGKFIVRVVYVEDPQRALPSPAPAKGVQWFDVRPGEDPLQVADALGRPLAIVRIGSRTPRNTAAPDPGFLYGSPPFVYLQAPPQPARNARKTPAAPVRPVSFPRAQMLSLPATSQ